MSFGNDQKADQTLPKKLWIVLVILQKLQEGLYGKAIADILNFSPQRVDYYIRWLETHGYIQKETRSNITTYRVTELGQKLLQWDVESKNGIVARFHHFGLAYDVLSGDLDRFLPLSKGSRLRGGVLHVDGVVEYDGEKFSVRRFHSPHQEQLFLYAPSTVGWEPWRLVSQLSIILDRLACFLASRHRLTLGKPRIHQRPEFAFQRDPFANLWGPLSGACFLGNGGGIDRSKGKWEVEFCDIRDAEAYLQMPTRLERIEKSMGVFADAMHEHLKLIEALQALVHQLEAVAARPVGRNSQSVNSP